MEALNRQIAAHAQQTPAIKLLMTLPGVDFTVAETILAALGDLSRFETPDKAASYLGLVPSTRQSGERCYHGPITKQGARHARWLLVQAAQHAALHPGPVGAFFRRIAQRKNRNVAVVAVAHKLVVLAWHMLRNNEPYRYAQPRTVEAKLSRLRIQATGQKRKGGIAKGQPRPQQYGKGRTKAIPGLDDLCAREGLPPLSKPKTGERAMLARQGLAGYADSVRVPKRVPRGREIGRVNRARGRLKPASPNTAVSLSSACPGAPGEPRQGSAAPPSGRPGPASPRALFSTEESETSLSKLREPCLATPRPRAPPAQNSGLNQLFS